MRSLTTSDGLPTNALYSLTLMILTALDRFKPDAVVCAFDAHAPSFRHLELDTYKGQRLAPPDELKIQGPIARELVQAFNFQLLEEPGFEADDVLGTLAERAKTQGHEVYVVTGDLDALQLVDDKHGPVRIVTTIKGLTETVVYDEAAVLERYGLTPAQIPDMKGLKGDTSDNLPGIPGIGDKTASKLLIEYGTVENLFAKLPEMKDEKLKAKIAPFEAQALQCKRLATIIRNVPLEDFEFALGYQERGANLDEIRPLFEKLAFRTLLKRIKGGSGSVATETEAPNLFSIETPPLKPQRNHEAPVNVSHVPAGDESSATAILVATGDAIEKADLMTTVPTGIAVARPGEESVVIPWDEIKSDSELLALLESPDVPKITYDAKLHIGIFERYGIELQGITFDALLAAYLISSARSGYPLAGILADYLNEEVAVDDATTLAFSLRRLEPVLRARLQQDGLEKLHDDLELPLSRVIAEMEREGVTIDVPSLATLGEQMEASLKELENDIYNLNEGERFAIGSTKQLQVVLFEKLKMPPGKKTKTGYSTDAEVLEGLAEQGFEIAAKILQWREVQKLKSTYVDALPTLVSPIDGKVHTSLRQTVASTGRLSSANPNLQNIPVRTEVGRQIRKSFVTNPGCVLVAADYSQIELRLFAFMTHDPELVRTFHADEDIHKRTASLIFGSPESEITGEQRRRAKTINFAVIYGMSSFRLAVELGVTGQIASDWRKRYFESYPGVREFADKILAEARERGYVQTLLGRRRYVPDITSRVFQFRQAAEREAVNMPVQGTAADIIKIAMLNVDKAMKAEGFTGKMVLQVHDELLFECPEGESMRLAKLVQREMEGAFDLGGIRLRADVKIGRNWSEMEQVA